MVARSSRLTISRTTVGLMFLYLLFPGSPHRVCLRFVPQSRSPALHSDCSDKYYEEKSTRLLRSGNSCFRGSPASLPLGAASSARSIQPIIALHTRAGLLLLLVLLLLLPPFDLPYAYSYYYNCTHTHTLRTHPIAAVEPFRCARGAGREQQPQRTILAIEDPTDASSVTDDGSFSFPHQRQKREQPPSHPTLWHNRVLRTCLPATKKWGVSSSE